MAGHDPKKFFGDAVIATDNQGCIKYMNPVAEALTGCSQAEALGKVSTEVFKIINARTRLPVSSPITQALQENRIVELEDKSLRNTLIKYERPYMSVGLRKDGSTLPIRKIHGRVKTICKSF